jgi:hypothetical protein
MIEIKLTVETSEAVLWAMREHLNQRLPVREYVDERYKHSDEAFRNRKIGEIQSRIDCLQPFINRLQTAVSTQLIIKEQP